jgi:hypothetical protein
MKPTLPIILLLLLALGAACSPPAASFALADLNSIQSAAQIRPGDNEMADRLIDSILSSASQQGVTVELKSYKLPEGLDWPFVRDFYSSQVDPAIWTLEQDFSEANAAVNSIGWSRETSDGEQALVVAFAEDVFGGGPLTIVILLSNLNSTE